MQPDDIDLVADVVVVAIKTRTDPMLQRLETLELRPLIVEAKTGKDGIDGTDGRDGIDGKDGARGLDGPIGQRGPAGIEGPPGPAGTNGLDGQPGEKGLDGIAGRDGVDGKHGIDGVDGKDAAIDDRVLQAWDDGLADARARIKDLEAVVAWDVPDDLTARVEAELRKELALVVPTGRRTQKRIVRDAHGRLERVVEEPA